MKFYASVRLDIRRTGAVKDGDEVIGSETRIKVVKNKMAPPFRQAETQIIYGQGFNLQAELINKGVELGLIEKTGAWYSYEGSKIGQGLRNASKWLLENKESAAVIEAALRAKMLGSLTAPVKAEAEAEEAEEAA